ncbi:MAG: SH3 domain-containing protein [Roseburia sp.]
MNQRMKLLGILLAGSVALGGSGILYAKDANAVQSGPVAGVSSAFGSVLAQGFAAVRNGSLAVVDEAAGTPEAASAESGGTGDAVAAASMNDVPVVASEYADIAIAQVNNYVHVRQEPHTESEILGKLYDNAAATVLSVTEDGWYQIQSGNVNGYVKAEYVVVGDENLARAVGTRFATVTTTTLFVRSEPTTEASVLTMVPEGDDLVVLDESVEGWVKVATVEGDGYVSADYVNLSTEYVHAESKEEEAARLEKEEAERQAAARAAEEARRAREAEEASRRAAEEAARKAAQSRSAKSPSNSGNAGNSAPSGNGAGSGSAGGSSSPSVSNGQAVVDYARQFLGNPYVYGGTSLTNGADCSGFVQSVYRAFGVSLPRNSTAQRSAGYAVSLSDIQPGDLVCYSGHIGIYAGNNTLIHASNEKTGITQTSPITYRPILAVRRIF